MKQFQLNFLNVIKDNKHKKSDFNVPRYLRLKIYNIFRHNFFIKPFGEPKFGQINAFYRQEHRNLK